MRSASDPEQKIRKNGKVFSEPRTRFLISGNPKNVFDICCPLRLQYLRSIYPPCSLRLVLIFNNEGDPEEDTYET